MNLRCKEDYHGLGNRFHAFTGVVCYSRHVGHYNDQKPGKEPETVVKAGSITFTKVSIPSLTRLLLQELLWWASFPK
jgi:uncharacterized short protein YbdD (DUF466 family)